MTIDAWYERGKSPKKPTHQCGVVCAADGLVFGPNGDHFRRAISMCKHSGCPLGYCSESCFNLWHHSKDISASIAHKQGGSMEAMTSGRDVGEMSDMIEEEYKQEGMSNDTIDHVLTP